LDNIPGNTITVPVGSIVFLDYNYQVWAGGSSWITQLVSGVESTVNTDGVCGYNGIPGTSPGVGGFVDDERLTAPATPGTYNIMMYYDLQFTCVDAVNNYSGGAKKIIGTLTVIPAPTTCGAPGSGNAAGTGCEVSNIQLNGVTQNIVAVPVESTVTLRFNYQVWDTICPTCEYQLIPGLGSTAAPTCHYFNGPGVYPGMTGITGEFNLTASLTPGDYGIFANLSPGATCAPENYLASGTQLATVTACQARVNVRNGAPGYFGPDPSYGIGGYFANETAQHLVTGRNADISGTLYYELTSPSWVFWVDVADVLATYVVPSSFFGDPLNCIPYKPAP